MLTKSIPMYIEDTRSLISCAEQAPKRETLETFWFNGNSVNVNLPPAFTEALQLTDEDEVTAEIITTADGRKGILLVKQKRRSN